MLSGELLSQPVAVDVMPILTMRAAKSAVPAGTRIVFTVRVSPGCAAKSVTLMRYDRDRGRWERETTRTLRNGKAAIVWPVRQWWSSFRAWAKRGDLNPGSRGVVQQSDPSDRRRRGSGLALLRGGRDRAACARPQLSSLRAERLGRLRHCPPRAPPCSRPRRPRTPRTALGRRRRPGWARPSARAGSGEVGE